MPKTEIPRQAEGTSSSVNVANTQAQGKPLGTTYTPFPPSVAAEMLEAAGDEAIAAMQDVRALFLSIEQQLLIAMRTIKVDADSFTLISNARQLGLAGARLADFGGSALADAMDAVLDAEKKDGGAQ